MMSSSLNWSMRTIKSDFPSIATRPHVLALFTLAAEVSRVKGGADEVT